MRLGPGDYFGYKGLVRSDATNEATVTANSEVVLCFCLTRRQFQSCLLDCIVNSNAPSGMRFDLRVAEAAEWGTLQRHLKDCSAVIDELNKQRARCDWLRQAERHEAQYMFKSEISTAESLMHGDDGTAAEDESGQGPTRKVTFSESVVVDKSSDATTTAAEGKQPQRVVSVSSKRRTSSAVATRDRELSNHFRRDAVSSARFYKELRLDTLDPDAGSDDGGTLGIDLNKLRDLVKAEEHGLKLSETLLRLKGCALPELSTRQVLEQMCDVICDVLCVEYAMIFIIHRPAGGGSARVDSDGDVLVDTDPAPMVARKIGARHINNRATSRAARHFVKERALEEEKAASRSVSTGAGANSRLARHSKSSPGGLAGKKLCGGPSEDVLKLRAECVVHQQQQQHPQDVEEPRVSLSAELLAISATARVNSTDGTPVILPLEGLISEVVVSGQTRIRNKATRRGSVRSASRSSMSGSFLKNAAAVAQPVIAISEEGEADGEQGETGETGASGGAGGGGGGGGRLQKKPQSSLASSVSAMETELGIVVTASMCVPLYMPSNLTSTPNEAFAVLYIANPGTRPSSRSLVGGGPPPTMKVGAAAGASRTFSGSSSATTRASLKKSSAAGKKGSQRSPLFGEQDESVMRTIVPEVCHVLADWECDRQDHKTIGHVPSTLVGNHRMRVSVLACRNIRIDEVAQLDAEASKAGRQHRGSSFNTFMKSAVGRRSSNERSASHGGEVKLLIQVEIYYGDERISEPVRSNLGSVAAGGTDSGGGGGGGGAGYNGGGSRPTTRSTSIRKAKTLPESASNSNNDSFVSYDNDNSGFATTAHASAGGTGRPMSAKLSPSDAEEMLGTRPSVTEDITFRSGVGCSLVFGMTASNIPFGSRALFTLWTESGAAVGWAACELYDYRRRLVQGRRRLAFFPGEPGSLLTSRIENVLDSHDRTVTTVELEFPDIAASWKQTEEARARASGRKKKPKKYRTSIFDLHRAHFIFPTAGREVVPATKKQGSLGVAQRGSVDDGYNAIDVSPRVIYHDEIVRYDEYGDDGSSGGDSDNTAAASNGGGGRDANGAGGGDGGRGSVTASFLARRRRGTTKNRGTSSVMAAGGGGGGVNGGGGGGGGRSPLRYRGSSMNPLGDIAALLKRDVFTTSILDDEKTLIWDMRGRLVSNPRALPLVVRCVPWAQEEQVTMFHNMLRGWRRPQPREALELLSFVDPKVRALAVSCLEAMSDVDFATYMLQLTRCVKFDIYHDSGLVRLLLRRAVLSVRTVGQPLFWHLQAEMEDEALAFRYWLMLDEFQRCSERHCVQFANQIFVTNILKHIQRTISESGGKLKTLAAKTAKLRQMLTEATFPQGFWCPVNPNVICTGVDIARCRLMQSKQMPLWVEFTRGSSSRGCSSGGNGGGGSGGGGRRAGKPSGSATAAAAAGAAAATGAAGAANGGAAAAATAAAMAVPNYAVLFKVGDDLRQDQLTLQAFVIMDKLWRDEGLDLKLRPYGCVVLGKDVGMLEIVPNCQTIASILTDHANHASSTFRLTVSKPEAFFFFAD